ncbi:MAG: hypothetical protein NZM00_08075, partial [Anaerolinea sp.]|nr:hypothetical protein [Anaerolinea sp.]
WIRVRSPQIEIGGDLITFQSAVINLEEVEAFALKEGAVALFIDGKGYCIAQSADPTAYQAALLYARKLSDQSL